MYMFVLYEICSPRPEAGPGARKFTLQYTIYNFQKASMETLSGFFCEMSSLLRTPLSPIQDLDLASAPLGPDPFRSMRLWFPVKACVRLDWH